MYRGVSMGQSVRRRVLVVGGAAVAVAAVRRRRGRWATSADPCGPEGVTLPEGETTVLTTDDGAELNVLTAGPEDGPLVVLPHCWMGSMQIWAPVARRLVAEGRRVILYDQRGHGASSLGTARLTVDRLGDDLARVLTKLDVSDAVVAGHSMGGMTVQALLANHPDLVADRIRGAALVATAAHPGHLKVPGWVADRMLGDRRQAAIAKQRLASLRRSVGVDAHRSHLEAAHAAMVGTSGQARAACLVAMGKMDYRPALSGFATPTVVLVGTRDTVTPVARGRELAGTIPGARLRLLEGYGHYLPLEAPDAVAEVIADLAAA